MDSLHPYHLLVPEYADEAIKIGQALMVIVRIAFALDRLADVEADEPERAGAHHVLLIPAHVLIEDRLRIDERKGIRERWKEAGRGKFQAEHHGGRIGDFDRVHDRPPVLPYAQHAFRGKDDLLPARRHVGRGQRRAVVELHILTDRERVGLAVIRRLRNQVHRSQTKCVVSEGFSGLTRISTL